MPYITKDSAGNVTGIFACEQYEGQEFVEVAVLYDAPPTPLQEIRALEQAHDDDQRKLNRQAAIDTALTIVCRTPQAAGKTRAEVHDIWYATNRGYKAMVDLEAAVVELRKKIK